MTFGEYVRSLIPKRPKVDYMVKGVVASIGLAVLTGGAIALGVPMPLRWFIPHYTGREITSYNPLFLLLFIGVPPLILYIIFCTKKEWGDIR